MIRFPFRLFALASVAATLAMPSRVDAQRRGRAETRTLPRDTSSTPANGWPVKVREHVDLWLHGFALLTDDTARVPLFRRGYADAMTVRKNAQGLVSDLDANASALRTALAARKELAAAQFAVLSFPNAREFDDALSAFIEAKGDPRKAPRARQNEVAGLAQIFSSNEDQEWARKFVLGLRSEQTKFHHAWWLDDQKQRAATLTAVDSLWGHELRPAIDRFLSGTRQAGGEIVLSPTLEGEGRTAGFGRRSNVIVTGFPSSPDAAREALYGVVHELVGAVVGSVVEDNLSPAQKRAGEGDRLASVALVRGGLMLLQQAKSDWAEGYARFYLRVAGVVIAPSDNPVAAIERAFPMAPELATALRTQIAAAFGGI